MTKIKNITVEYYLTNRNKATYYKQIRILDNSTHKNCGNWWENANKPIKNVKITQKYLFIFI